MATSDVFKEGFDFYISNLGLDGKEHNSNLAVNNPYIVGSDDRAKAYQWWCGLDRARHETRHPKLPPIKTKAKRKAKLKAPIYEMHGE